ncbi:MAG: hypothetical protein JO023_24460 [Chloroflexi bacterium]|nr:hypothetical protein [Chloroflexota bacterium]
MIGEEASPVRRGAALAAARWFAAAGPWRRWSLVVPLLGLPADTLARPVEGGPAARVADEQAQGRGEQHARRSDHELGPGSDHGRNLAQVEWVLAGLGALSPERCLVLVDLAPGLGVAVGARAYERGQAHPVLVLGRWPAAQAILPARPLVETLIACAPPARRGRLPSAVVVLDGERGQPLSGRSPRDRRTDNRYALDLDDLPDASTVHAFGVQRVHAVVRARPSSGPDARSALPRYAAAGLAVSELVVPW